MRYRSEEFKLKRTLSFARAVFLSAKCFCLKIYFLFVSLSLTDLLFYCLTGLWFQLPHRYKNCTPPQINPIHSVLKLMSTAISLFKALCREKKVEALVPDSYVIYWNYWNDGAVFHLQYNDHRLPKGTKHAETKLASTGVIFAVCTMALSMREKAH